MNYTQMNSINLYAGNILYSSNTMQKKIKLFHFLLNI